MNIKKIIKEEINDWDWLKDVPEQNPTELRNYRLIVDAFAGTEFNVDLDVVLRHNYAFINDKDGINYTVLRLNGDSWDWAQKLRGDIRQAENICGNDCELTQNFKEIYRIFNEYFFPKINNVNESEEDDFDWVRDINPIVPFEAVVLGEKYTIVNKTDIFLDAIEHCGDDEDMYLSSQYVKVRDIEEMSYNSVFCGSPNDERVLSLFLEFMDSDDNSIDTFWVADDMLTLGVYLNPVNENFTIKESDYSQKHTTCSRFRNEDERLVCQNIHSLKSWLHKDTGLGLRRVIDDKLRNLIDYRDLNDEYQEPLGYLYSTGKYPDIKHIDGKYYFERLKNRGRILNPEGSWDFVNKLNTNYSDLAELLTQLFINAGIIDNLKNKNLIGLRKYLLSIKDRISQFLDVYIKPEEYFDFTRNTRVTSEAGEIAENKVRDILDTYGLKTVYQGGNGDFVDMIFGIDLILRYKSRYFTVQVKNTHNSAKDALESKKYNNIDYFASPTDNGIVIINQKGEETFIDEEGRVI